jgi:hypothetical protein
MTPKQPSSGSMRCNRKVTSPSTTRLLSAGRPARRSPRPVSCTTPGVIDDVKKKVTPGTSALFLLTDDAVVDQVENALKDMHPHLIASNLSAEQEAKLREAFAED